MRVVFFKPVHAARARIGPLGANHGLLQPSLADAICTASCV